MVGFMVRISLGERCVHSHSFRPFDVQDTCAPALLPGAHPWASPDPKGAVYVLPECLSTGQPRMYFTYRS